MTSFLPATTVHVPNIASLHTPASLPVQILLVTEQGAVLEGTQTNFFAIQDNKLHTAQEGVLMGTVRGVVLQVHCVPNLHFSCIVFIFELVDSMLQHVIQGASAVT